MMSSPPAESDFEKRFLDRQKNRYDELGRLAIEPGGLTAQQLSELRGLEGTIPTLEDRIKRKELISIITQTLEEVADFSDYADQTKIQAIINKAKGIPDKEQRLRALDSIYSGIESHFNSLPTITEKENYYNQVKPFIGAEGKTRLTAMEGDIKGVKANETKRGINTLLESGSLDTDADIAVILAEIDKLQNPTDKDEAKKKLRDKMEDYFNSIDDDESKLKTAVEFVKKIKSVLADKYLTTLKSLEERYDNAKKEGKKKAREDKLKNFKVNTAKDVDEAYQLVKGDADSEKAFFDKVYEYFRTLDATTQNEYVQKLRNRKTLPEGVIDRLTEMTLEGRETTDALIEKAKKHLPDMLPDIQDSNWDAAAKKIKDADWPAIKISIQEKVGVFLTKAAEAEIRGLIEDTIRNTELLKVGTNDIQLEVTTTIKELSKAILEGGNYKDILEDKGTKINYDKLKAEIKSIVDSKAKDLDDGAKELMIIKLSDITTENINTIIKERDRLTNLENGFKKLKLEEDQKNLKELKKKINKYARIAVGAAAGLTALGLGGFGIWSILTPGVGLGRRMGVMTAGGAGLGGLVVLGGAVAAILNPGSIYEFFKNRQITAELEKMDEEKKKQQERELMTLQTETYYAAEKRNIQVKVEIENFLREFLSSGNGLIPDKVSAIRSRMANEGIRSKPKFASLAEA